MITRYSSVFEKGHSVVPRVRVALNKATMLEMEYEWDGVKGTAPALSMDLDSDAAHEKFFLAAVYQNAAGERRVVVDAKVVDMAVPPLDRVASSADAVLGSEGWNRLFTIFQISVPPGVIGTVEEENVNGQIFEYSSRS